uniref:AAA family ATPase n=1 Tax=Trichocoleus desertorum TaxID=1481672 RepID=UPI0025B4B6AB|nr:SMC family ATPase [Trichocoleus desertorum]
MEILSISLKNFKAHSDRYFEFQPGTNAICGENGAGKTSILEAIAWALFNYSSYTKEELIRRGAASAQVSVTFTSRGDGRTYRVQRCTSKGYEIFDPQIRQRLDLKNVSDVLPWLKEHLGVAKETDLPKLFADTIGIPQGTFTEDFKKAADERRKVFDRILRVDEYKQAFEKSRDLEKYAQQQVQELERAIAYYTENLRDWDLLHTQRADLQQEVTKDKTALQQLQTQLEQLQHQKDRLTAQSHQIQQLEVQFSTLQVQLTGQRQTNVLLEQSLQRAKQAVATCEANRAGYQTFVQAESALQALDRQSKQQQALLKQRQGYQMTWENSQAKLTKLTLQLENLTAAQQEIEQLQPLIQQQAELEQAQEAIAQQLQQLFSAELERQNVTKQLAKLKGELEHLGPEIERIRSFEAVLGQIPTWEQQRDRLQEQLSRIAAAKQFEADLSQIVSHGETQRDRYLSDAATAIAGLQELQRSVPLLAASVDSALATLQAGVDLNNEILENLQQILGDLSEQVSASKLEQQLREVKRQLETAYQQRTHLAGLETLLGKQTALQQETAELQAKLQHLQTQLANQATLQQQKLEVAAEVAALGNPRGRSQLRQQELQQQTQLQMQYDQAQQAQMEVAQAVTHLEAQLAEFVDLPDQIEVQKTQKVRQQAARDLYLQNQKDAEQLPTLEANFEAAIAQLSTLTTNQAIVQAQLAQLAETYDPRHLQEAEATYNAVRSQKDQIEGGLPQKQKFLYQIEHQLAELQAIADQRIQAQVNLLERQRVQQFISDARQVYNQAGPRITKFYIEEISREADKLFRELINRQNVALEWTGDYEIRIQEGGYWRTFRSLSGGEQMCAALAVRLALLKVLADIDVAFFDEPTTNMDRSRREQLAEAIANIKSFHQLFIISHDDTFENVTENLIRVEREAL